MLRYYPRLGVCNSEAHGRKCDRRRVLVAYATLHATSIRHSNTEETTSLAVNTSQQKKLKPAKGSYYSFSPYYSFPIFPNKLFAAKKSPSPGQTKIERKNLGNAT